MHKIENSCASLRLCCAIYVYLHNDNLKRKIMATIKAFVRATGKKVFVNVRFRLTDGRSVQLFHKSDIKVNPNDFDSKKETIKAKVIFNEKARKEFNKAISDRKDLINEIYLTAKDKSSLTSDWLEAEIDKKLNPEKYEPKVKAPETVLQFIDKFIKEAPQRKDKTTGRTLTYNNIQQYKATQKHLIAFAKQIKKSDFQFSDINTEFYQKFVSYLQNLQFTQNSVGKHIRVFKLMLNEANRPEVNMKNFYVFTEEVDNVYLNETELQQLKDFDFSESPYLDRVRDWFLLLAWTGSRFSDLEKIQRTDIRDNMITFRQQKTNTKVVIPLHPVVISILEKYNYQMPESISNQKFNEFIKEACQTAKIDTLESFTRTVGGKLITETKPKYELVSSHTGRRSFCTNMYLRGLDTMMIRSISGHKTEKSFLKYIKVSQQQHAEMMAKKWSEIYK